jgi:hydroxymethylpyrimidine/phosphomethylpyrimidine kinase
VTALTIQNTQQTRSYWLVPQDELRQQLDFLFEDLMPKAVKIGMLGGAPTVEVVAQTLERYSPQWVVLDPILRASSGIDLLDAVGREAMLKRLLPLTSVITPNLEEAEALTGMNIRSVAQMEEAAAALARYGVPSVIITGGHLDRPIDLLYEGGRATSFAGDRVKTGNTHGTGCTFAAAITANLALGRQLPDAVVMAKAYVTAALKASYNIGSGRGPLNHLYRLQEAPRPRAMEHPEPEYVSR